MDLKDIEIQQIKGVGPQRAKILNKMGIRCLEDMVMHIPREYKDMGKIQKLHDIVPGENTAFVARIMAPPQMVRVKKNLAILSVQVKDESGSAVCIWYNQIYMKSRLQPNTVWLFYGKAETHKGTLRIVNPSMDEWEEESNIPRILPVYPLTEKLTQKVMRKLMMNVLENITGHINDELPESFRTRYKLAEINYAIQNIHFPIDMDAVEKARRRLVFEELLYFQIALQTVRLQYARNKSGISFQCEKDTLTGFVDKLPFRLTSAQTKVLSEIVEDMRKPQPMNRLIQGDVGSGKTILAIAALYIAVQNGYQGALMAPTEILAEQHYHAIKNILGNDGVRIGLLKGSLGKAQRNEAIYAIEHGEWDIVVGTHALIQEDIHFQHLGLVVTDEQHRFGVRQRAILSEKGETPDMLVMSATPIPRTLALILYGDLDVSIIDELPPGRREIMTRYVSPEKRDKMYHFILEEIRKGRQAYVVCPLVEHSEFIEAVSAAEMFENLKNRFFSNIRVGLLHGKMKSEEKEKVMNDFYQGNLDLLVSTTVIEVGVDVPNASIMVIEDAGRFGLAQLHQLRGRVGRGAHQSYCFLLSDARSKDAAARIKVMTQTSNGFVIAEKDLAMRGPGEFLGVRQHGLPEFKVANLIRDMKVVKETQKAVVSLLNGEFSKEETARIVNAAQRKYGEKVDNVVLN